MLKSLVATIMKRSRSSGRPKRASSQATGHQRVHGVLGLVQVAGAHVDLQQVVRPARVDALLARHQVAGHQGEQVAGLFVRVDPLGEVAAVVQLAGSTRLPLDSSTGYGLVGAQRDGVAGHHVGAVQEVGDAAEALGLALGEERVLAHVQAHQLGVLGRRW
jgi:hypothetical protein